VIFKTVSMSIFCFFILNKANAQGIDGRWIKSNSQEPVCENGQTVSLPFWIGQSDYLWEINGDILTISFKAKILGLTAQHVSIDYTLSFVVDNELVATPSDAGIEDYGASEFRIRLLENSLLSIRSGNPIFCDGSNILMHMSPDFSH
jgi:hypothetical protein